MPVCILGDLIADLSVRVDTFPITAQDLHPVSYLELGPGGATNIAIMAARFGLAVSCFGELGKDPFGDIVWKGLQREHIETEHILVSPQTRTPVAGVVVDEQREPAYLGYQGELHTLALPSAWRTCFQLAQALFADGWIEIPQMADMLLEAFDLARAAGVPTFFDPGPGNGKFDNAWHRAAAARATVLLVNEQEAARLTNLTDPFAAAQALLSNGSELVVLKRGAKGMLLVTRERVVDAPGLTVNARDLTGAGDSVTGAILYGYLNGLDLQDMGTLANATGAAKVQKLGTGHNMPTLAEVRAVLETFAPHVLERIPQTKEITGTAFSIEPLTSEDRSWVREIMREHWGGDFVVGRGRIHYPEQQPGFKAVAGETRVGLVTYEIVERACEVVLLQSFEPRMGIGTALLNAVKATARGEGCRRMWLITTNDNLNALGFYQRYGFQLAALYPNAMAEVRRLKPGLPDIGENGIPLRDEIELELML